VSKNSCDVIQTFVVYTRQWTRNENKLESDHKTWRLKSAALRRLLRGVISVVTVRHQYKSEYPSVPSTAHSLAYYMNLTLALAT
jgi:hypothetical protein